MVEAEIDRAVRVAAGMKFGVVPGSVDTKQGPSASLIVFFARFDGGEVQEVVIESFGKEFAVNRG